MRIASCVSGIAAAVAMTMSATHATERPPLEWTPGIGADILSAGRFGWRKGDGLLDFTYNKFGVMERPVFTGHSLNKTGKAWQIDIRPPLARNDKEIRPSEWPEIIKDECAANWISVRWKSDFVSTGEWHGRQKNDRFSFTVSYSIASPGLVVETDDRAFNISLDSTPGYEAVELPLAKEPSTLPIPLSKPLVYDAKRDGKLSENWILLRGGSFPDVPLLLLFERNPAVIEQKRKEGKLNSLCIAFEGAAGRIIICAPCGVKAFDSGESSAPANRAEIIAAARFWSRALLAFITDCKEFFALDEADGTIVIRQDFSYRTFSDEWGTLPIQTAPYPPLLDIAAAVCGSIRLLTPPAADVAPFPARYGRMKIVAGAASSSYVLPIPPLSPRIPIPPAGSNLKKSIEASLRVATIAKDAPLPNDCFPGLWSRIDRCSVDVASVLGFHYWLWPYLSEENLANLRSRAKALLLDLLDDQEAFAETSLFKAIQQTPADAGRLTRPIWFPRREPFTGKEYVLSYTVPNVRREGKSVSDPNACYTDTEWGNGFALQGIEQGATLSGDWDAVKRNWPMVKKIEGLFEMLQDWANLSVSGTECGSRWTDPSSNYGYNAYRRLAEAVGSEKERRQAIYLHAKHAASFIGSVFAGEYLAGVYHESKPWTTTDSNLVEMDSGYKVPEPQREGRNVCLPEWSRGDSSLIRRNSFYSLVAEGVNYETADLFHSLAPKATHAFLADYLRLYPEWLKDESWTEEMNKRHYDSGGITVCELMLFEIRDPSIATKAIAEQVAHAAKTGLLRKHLKGFYNRYYGAQELVEALLETRGDPAWIDTWRGLAIESATFDREAGTVSLQVSTRGVDGVLFLGGAQPKDIALNGSKIPEAASKAAAGWHYARGSLRVPIESSGKLVLRY